MLDALKSGSKSFQGLVRCTKLNGKPLVFSGMVNTLTQEEDPEVMCTPLFKRRNFEAPNTLTARPSAVPMALSERSASTVRLCASECTVDSLDYSRPAAEDGPAERPVLQSDTHRDGNLCTLCWQGKKLSALRILGRCVTKIPDLCPVVRGSQQLAGRVPFSAQRQPYLEC